MCGIVGYVGKNQAMETLVNSLKKLEYRGYDSAGVSVLNGNITTYKTEGSIDKLSAILPSEMDGKIGIAHTRWATHGAPSTTNAHPHESGDFSVVHNGIIENYLEIREKLEQNGYEFKSETDTEVIVHLINFNYSNNSDSSFYDAVRESLQELEGSYAVAILCKEYPDTLIAARKDSPLVLGLGDSEVFVSSDVTAFLDHTKNVVFVEDGEIVSIDSSGVNYTNFDGQNIQKEITTIDWDVEAAEKAGYEHFMLKEIHEQVSAIQDTFSGKIFELEGKIKLDELNLDPKDITEIERIEIIACGTSWNAGLLAKYLFEKIAGVHTDVSTSSEFRYGDPVMRNDVLTIAITQSGETADTLAAIRSTNQYGCNSIAITNVVGSTITRETENVLYTRAGPEIGVAATKTFTSQLLTLYLLAIYFGRIRYQISAEDSRELLEAIKRLPGQIQKVLEQRNQIKECAVEYSDVADFFFIGRYLNYPIALEGALKLKEISYIHAEGYAAGELKHGPIALLTKDTPVVAIATHGNTYEKILSNIKEVKARSAKVIAVADEDDREIRKYVDTVLKIPKTHELLSPILSAVVLQLLAYYVALERGCAIDKPRNLAKSVTVE
ncbi:glucosamine--fructose-6-phosphate aminotransferase (isomerizing) [Methanohalophilus levihalophilus]|uniref:glutamine--fructose-6-phosphate transaminase (isomerizing) n=1 Tax=Methanohalophilus levihalophilus TaxID=1431282 RepID=UPI001AE5CACE|nr:glutamine--fructose-6-phosphate transaminase (isomerizing) [Methanohalophilus levihalophilus]MBP2031079.1 glucosamine--fructose-6-phosphate aminotransferase (isomerizing) [Methanohalophilus levihalophilus]